MRESKDWNKLKLHDLFDDLKAYEFELKNREGDQSTYQVTKALSAVELESTVSVKKSAEQLSNDAMSLFLKNLKHSWERINTGTKSHIIRKT